MVSFGPSPYMQELLAATAGLLMNRTEFDEFLFAPLGDEENGMTLSVVSALARLGFDPWREAARLAGLPKPQAEAALAGLFGRLPAAADRPDAAAYAAQLIGLLPRSGAEGAAGPAVSASARRLRRPRLGFGAICLLLALAAMATTLTIRNLSSRDAPAAATVSARQ